MTRNTPLEPDVSTMASAAVDADTIAAIATAPGMAGIGIVRISGPAALAIGRRMSGRSLTPRYAHYAEFRDAGGSLIDVGLCLAFPGPASFTGEDVVELQGHGGPVVLQLLLDAVLGAGARLARPGEFTERAFHNGKLDLAQAEAVADLIASASGAAARGAMRSLQGTFSRAVGELDGAVTELRVYVEAAMDFPEEDADFLAEGQVPERLAAVRERLAALTGETRQGMLLSEGVAVALVGAPNVGKSSLLNRLAGQDRAIVTEIPGTTRDLVHADLTLKGLPIRIVDTAGIRDAADAVEEEGIRRAREQALQADLVVVLEDDRAAEGPVLETLQAAGIEPRRLLRVRNKVDLSGGAAGAVAGSAAGAVAVVRLSALTGAGVDALVDLILERVGYASEGSTFTARRRHIEALDAASAAVARAESLLAERVAPELVAEELKLVHQSLGEIVGETTADELLGEIFSSFCIGK